MVNYMRLIREIVRAQEAHNKECECTALCQVAWLCMHEVEKMSGNERAVEICDKISDLTVRQIIDDDPGVYAAEICHTHANQYHRQTKEDN